LLSENEQGPRTQATNTTEERKSPIFYDDEVIGFGLQVRSNGRKTSPSTESC
jgi:hypothetical protein